MASFTFTDFGNASNNAFLGDVSNREHILEGGAKIDTAAVYVGAGEYTIEINDAAATQGDTTVTVVALPVALPDNTELKFGSVTVTLNGGASAAATSLTVDALGGDIANHTTATYDADSSHRVLAAGTLLGRTIAERNSGAGFGPAGDSDDEIYILAADVDLTRSDDIDLIRHGTLIKTNFLSTYSAASSTVKGKLETQYQLMLG